MLYIMSLLLMKFFRCLAITARIDMVINDCFSLRRLCSGISEVRTVLALYFVCEQPQGVVSSFTSPHSVSTC